MAHSQKDFLGLLEFPYAGLLRTRPGLIIIGQYKAIAAQNGFNRRIFDEFQEAQDDQFLGFLGLKCHFLRSGTPKIGSGRSNLYIGRWS